MGCWSKPGPSSSGPRPPTGVTERWPCWVSRVEQPFQEFQTVLQEGRTLEHGACRDHGFGERRVRVSEALFWPNPLGSLTGHAHCIGGIGQKARAVTLSRSTLSISAAPNAANAMALGHGDRCLIARSIPFEAKWRIRWSSLCDMAVPRPQMLLPQQSSSAGGSSQAPFRFIRFRHLPRESSASRRNPTLSVARLRIAGAVHRSLTATTSTRAMSSVQ